MSILESEERDDDLILRLKVPRMDTMQSSLFKRELENYVNVTQQRIILSLAETEYLDSSSLGVFRKFAVELGERGGNLILCDLNPSVAKLLKVSRLEMLFEIQPDISAALASGS